MNILLLLGYAVLLVGLGIGLWGWRMSKRQPVSGESAAGRHANAGSDLERIGVIVVMIGFAIVLAVSVLLRT